MRFLIFFIFIVPFFSFAQLESSNWYFGENAGVQFNENGIISILNNGTLNTSEGCATISSSTGDLLFYTDGRTVWNSSHQIMQNGEDLLGHQSSTQSAIIVPQPETPNIFYIFTVDFLTALTDGFRYSIVDTSLNNGLGSVTVKNILLETTPLEKAVAILHANGKDRWIIGHQWNNNSFFSYLLTENGLNIQPVISAIGSTINGDFSNGIGYLIASPDGKKLASAKSFNDNYLEIFDFDNETGVISNSILIDQFFQEGTGVLGPYGLSFSPNNEFLYIGDTAPFLNFSRIHRLNISHSNSNDILASQEIIYEGNHVFGALQLGIDNNIYISEATDRLSVIKNPDSETPVFELQSIDLNGRNAAFGLPPLIESNFNANVTYECNNMTINFTTTYNKPIAFIEWDFGDGSFSNEINPSHSYTNYGNYTVQVTIQSGLQERQFSFDIESCNLFIPQGFSPNNDGINDWFNIKGLYDVFTEHELVIYNRYGQIVFKGNNENPFLGFSNKGLLQSSSLLPSGTYFYHLNLNNSAYKTPFTGWVYMNY